jgi:hypothetical protein
MDKEENFLKMYKIQASFIGNVKCLVKEGRVFVREGALIKMCRKVSGSPLPPGQHATPGPHPAHLLIVPNRCPRSVGFSYSTTRSSTDRLWAPTKPKRFTPPPPSLTPCSPRIIY